MKLAKPAKQTAAFCAAIALFAISGCGGGSDDAADANMAAVDEDSPEFIAMQYRQGLMQVIGYKVGALRDMAEGAIEADTAVFAKHASDAATAAGMLLEGFVDMEASSTDALPGSGALPEVWSDWDDFTQKAAELAAAGGRGERGGECARLHGLGRLRGAVGARVRKLPSHVPATVAAARARAA